MWRVVSIKSDNRRLEKIGVPRDTSRLAVATLENKKLDISMSVHLYLPKNLSKCKNIVVSIHGMNRNSRHYRNIFVPYAHNKNVLIIAPRFKADRIKHKEALIYGNTRNGSLANLSNTPKEVWTFTMIGEIIESLAKQLGLNGYEVNLFGHSAGAQFVQRLPYFYNLKKLNKIIIANPGWFTLPDTSEKFPIGIKDLEIQNQLKNIFNKKIILITGAKDIDLERVNKNSLVIKQGKNRHERAINYFSHCKQIAIRNDYDFQWQLLVAKNLGHSAKKAAKIASDHII